MYRVVPQHGREVPVDRRSAAGLSTEAIEWLQSFDLLPVPYSSQSGYTENRSFPEE